MGCGLDLPMTANGVGCVYSGELCVRDVEGGLGGPVPQAAQHNAGEHFAFDADDRGDVRMPFRCGEFFGWIEDRDDAPFVAIAAPGTTADRIDWGRCRGDLLELLVQCRLIVLDLDDQRNIGLGRDLEGFFWQCRASMVTIAPSASPSSASNFCAAGISFDFSGISICASTSAVSVAKALST
jgi:hypothetical protein